MDDKELYLEFLQNKDFDFTFERLKRLERFEESNLPLSVLSAITISEELSENNDTFIVPDFIMERMLDEAKNDNYVKDASFQIRKGYQLHMNTHPDHKDKTEEEKNEFINKIFDKQGVDYTRPKDPNANFHVVHHPEFFKDLNDHHDDPEVTAHILKHAEGIRKHLEKYGPNGAFRYDAINHDGTKRLSMKHVKEGMEKNSPAARAQRKNDSGHIHIPGHPKYDKTPDRHESNRHIHYMSGKDKKITLLGITHKNNINGKDLTNSPNSLRVKTNKWAERDSGFYEEWLKKFQANLLYESLLKK